MSKEEFIPEILQKVDEVIVREKANPTFAISCWN